jgi:hypothetical protein
VQNSTAVFQLNFSNNTSFCASISRPNAKPQTLQFQRLEKLLQTLQLPIHQFWYVRQRDPERFMIEYLQDQKENEWLKKYGDEFITKRQQSFAERRAYIDTIRQAASKYIWKIVDMDYQPNLTEQYIKQKIHNRA